MKTNASYSWTSKLWIRERPKLLRNVAVTPETSNFVQVYGARKIASAMNILKQNYQEVH